LNPRPNERPNESRLNTFAITLEKPHQGLTTFCHQTTLALYDKNGLNILFIMFALNSFGNPI
jgi:hypothetical protein